MLRLKTHSSQNQEIAAKLNEINDEFLKKGEIIY
jgi:hypothetical protein